MGFLIPSTNPTSEDNTDTPIVWRGLMVQKAVQQLLFDVDWSKDGQGLDVLVIDMPPGTGDVPLTLGQLVNVDGMHDILCGKPRFLYLSARICNCVHTARRSSLRCQKRNSYVEKSICSGKYFKLSSPLKVY